MPSELVYNCESLPRKPRNNERIRLVMPANLKYVVMLNADVDLIWDSQNVIPIIEGITGTFPPQPP